MIEKIVVGPAFRGILCEPSQSRSGEGLPLAIFLNAGLTHRIGPNRLYVKLARHLAATGIASLRLDQVGWHAHERCNEEWSEGLGYLKEAIDCLPSWYRNKKCLLIGLCSGADEAFRYASQAKQVVGVVLINGTFFDRQAANAIGPWLQWRIRQRYYRKCLRSVRKLIRVILGQSDIRTIMRHAMGYINVKKRSHAVQNDTLIECREKAAAQWRAISKQQVDVLLIASEGSVAYDVYEMLVADFVQPMRESGRLTTDIFLGVDHLFTPRWSQERLIEAIMRWNETRSKPRV